MPSNLSEIGRILLPAMRQYQHDKETLTQREFRKKWPSTPTPASIRAKAAKDCARIRKRGGMPWQVWEEGYKGMGATIPMLIGVYDAPTFEDACVMARKDGGGWGEPFHPTEQKAWAAHDAHWSRVGPPYFHPDDPRRPPRDA